ncbi:hypothetical protein MYX06_02445 [Patescibacteria group bacterium AH-259-L05]|nr:hypothetical protein [Patescibacteria group bacterium AH-259-L05]
MSDARTAIGRDDQRAKGIQHFLSGVRSYLKGNLSLKKVKERAEQTSDIRGGYFRGAVEVDLTTGLEEMLKKLKQGDRQTWVEFLYQAWISTDLYKLSPFAGKVLFRVDYEGSYKYPGGVCIDVRIVSYPRGFVLERTLNQIIQDKDWITEDGDGYVVSIDTLKVENTILSIDGVEAYWVGNGTKLFRCSDGEDRCLKMPRKVSDWTNFGTEEQRDKYCGFENKG